MFQTLQMFFSAVSISFMLPDCSILSPSQLKSVKVEDLKSHLDKEEVILYAKNPAMQTQLVLTDVCLRILKDTF